MKRLTVFMLTVILLLSISPVALAADHAEARSAQTLYALGLFKGTGTNADGTPIFDIKPYLAYADSHPEATEGFRTVGWSLLSVDFPEPLLALVPEADRAALMSVLANDPRPSYHSDPERVYGMNYGNFEIKFRVNEDILTVTAVENPEK